MFSIIYCFFPILLVIFNMYLLKSREYISWDVKKGKMCYNCKTDLNLSEEEIFKRLGNYIDEHMKLCLSCSRDIKLSSIISPIKSLKFKFERFLFSKKSDNIFYYFTGFVFFFIILDIILISFGIKMKLYLIYGTINILFWILTTYKTIYTTIKKPSE